MKTSGLYEDYNATSVSGRAGYDRTEDIKSKERVFNAHILPRIEAGGFKDAVDVGCGYGAYVSFMTGKGLVARGVDLSREQIEVGRAQFGLESIHTGDGMQFLKGLPTASVDLVLMLDILEHLPLEVCIDMLGEVRRVLRTGGEAIVMCPNIHAPFQPTFSGDVTHVRAFSRASLRQLAMMAGFFEVTVCAQKMTPCTVMSSLRIFVWHIFFNPLLNVLAVAMHGTNCGGIFSPNLVAVMKKESAASGGR